MTRKNILFMSLGELAILLVCVGAGFFAFGVYDYLSDRGFSLSELPEFPLPQLGDDSNPQYEPNKETPLGEDVDLEELFSPFWESRQLLHDNFVSQPIDDKALARGALFALTRTFNGLNNVLVEIDPPVESISAEQHSIDAGTPSEVEAVFLSFWKAWSKFDNLVSTEEDITYEMLMRSALSGMVDALGDDPTSYMDPFQFHQSQSSLDGEYEGIGAWVDTTAEFLTIISPMSGSPAEKAGLLPGDRFIAIDGEDMVGINPNLALQKVLGPAGSIVVLTVERDDIPEPFDVEIIRSRISIPNIEAEILEDSNIAYLKLFNFGSSSAEDLHVVLADLLGQNPDGLILDLRNNGGGYLHASVNITSEFIATADELVLTEEYGDGTQDLHLTRAGGIAGDIPMVVLVNEGSASASEIVAGALQDHGRAQLVGTISFGKGSVQLP
ncbi:MAG: S41 family peptidase, partial [Chloroflexota bacterium]